MTTDADGFTLVTKRRKKVVRDFDTEDYDKFFKEENEECKKLLATIENFIGSICRSFADKAVQAVANGDKTFYLFTYDNNTNNKIGDYATEYILKNDWVTIVQRYAPSIKISIEDRILKYIKTHRFNNGIDPITKKEYKISIFHYKKDKSLFKNGIMISRNGIQYT